MSASGSCDSAVDGLGGAEAGQVGKRLAETGDEVHVAVTSTIVQMSTQFMLQVVMGAEGTHVDCYEDSSRDAEDETCVRWQVATVKDGPGTAASPVL